MSTISTAINDNFNYHEKTRKALKDLEYLDTTKYDMKTDWGYSDWDRTDSSDWDTSVDVDLKYFEDTNVHMSNMEQSCIVYDCKTSQTLWHSMFKIVECGAISDEEEVESYVSLHRGSALKPTNREHVSHCIDDRRQQRIVGWTLQSNHSQYLHQQLQSHDISACDPSFRIVECGGNRWDHFNVHKKKRFSMDDAHDEEILGPSSSFNRTKSHYNVHRIEAIDERNNCRTFLPLHRLRSHQGAIRQRVANQALISTGSRERNGIEHDSNYLPVTKKVRFLNPIVTSITYVPRIQDSDIGILFYSDSELEQQYKENSFEMKA